MKKGRSKLGQIWIETVIYTLIAMIMIGAVLAWGKPKIEELQDKSIIEQTLGVFEDIDSQIQSAVEGGAGNKRVVEIGLKKGSIKIWAEDVISYEMSHEPSKPSSKPFVETVLEQGADHHMQFIYESYLPFSKLVKFHFLN